MRHQYLPSHAERMISDNRHKIGTLAPFEESQDITKCSESTNVGNLGGQLFTSLAKLSIKSEVMCSAGISLSAPISYHKGQ